MSSYPHKILGQCFINIKTYNFSIYVNNLQHAISILFTIMQVIKYVTARSHTTLKNMFDKRFLEVKNCVFQLLCNGTWKNHMHKHLKVVMAIASL